MIARLFPLTRSNLLWASRRWMSAASAAPTSRIPLDVDSLLSPERIRNIAIIAHVDHGKTSLVDGLLKQATANLGALAQQDRIMDSNDLEKERGITILSKVASCIHAGTKINIIDTPGHSDFGGEVERVLSMVDGVALIVDAREGPMTQTKFVLAKALQQQLRPIVIINKCDRETMRVDEVESEVLDLFLSLDAADHLLDYPVVYASAKMGWARLKLGDDNEDMQPLLDLIVKTVPPPRVSLDDPFSMLVTQLESDSYVGKCAVGKIHGGSVALGDRIKCIDESGKQLEEGRALKLFSRSGCSKNVVESAIAGDIVSIAGLPSVSINCTIGSMEISDPIPTIPIDPPTLAMTISVNDSPLQGKDGSKLTSSMLRDRLYKEIETNVAMQIVESDSRDSFEVRGRGELHLGILLENMRREGYEMSVSPPRVIFKSENGQQMEPMEELRIRMAKDLSGTVIQKITKRKGEMKNFVEDGDEVELEFDIPSRGLLGYPSEFRNDTSGAGLLNHVFTGYGPLKGAIDKSRKGSMISTASGVTSTHAILSIEPRGVLYVSPGDEVYAGMVIGEHNKSPELRVNPVKTKQLTNIRTVNKDETVRLTPARPMTLEQVLSYIQDDEIIEVTPKNIRVRKRSLEAK